MTARVLLIFFGWFPKYFWSTHEAVSLLPYSTDLWFPSSDSRALIESSNFLLFLSSFVCSHKTLMTFGKLSQKWKYDYKWQPFLAFGCFFNIWTKTSYSLPCLSFKHTYYKHVKRFAKDFFTFKNSVLYLH